MSQIGAAQQAAAERIRLLEDAVASSVLGQEEAIAEVTACLLAGGHALVEGPPGIAKTLLVRALARASGLDFSRIQFTPDLLPADITGTEILVEAGEGGFAFREGPLFSHLVLADEINRATPRTQSALLEAMAERSVSVGRERHRLPSPFAVMATQNPIEHEGTFPLPEAQLDRFLAKVLMSAPREASLLKILERTHLPEPPLPAALLGPRDVLALQEAAREVAIAPPLLLQVARVVRATDPSSPKATDSARRHLRLGASPRGGEALCRLARVRALREGRGYVVAADLAWALRPVLRHRLLPSFEAEARGLVADALVADVLHDLAELPEEVEAVLRNLEDDGT